MSSIRTSAAHAMSSSGLSTAEVAERVAAGRTNAVTAHTSRPVADIVRANLLTRFNGLLLALFAATMATGHWQNGLFGAVIVANSGIGVVQEVRAKRTLDRLAVLNAARVRVVRASATSDVGPADVVIDDLVDVRAGDQVAVDGLLVESRGLEVDESLLTGEVEPVVKRPGETVRSGSVVVAGRGRFRTTAVRADAYAARLTAQARRYTVVRSELVSGTGRILTWISLMMLVVGPLLLWSQFRSEDTADWRDAVTGTVAGLVGMIPEGLVLLTSLAFALATVTLARQQTLVQELAAVEGLARVDVVCLDKTGTLTYGDMSVERLDLLERDQEHNAREALGLLSGDPDDANATARTLASTFPRGTWQSTRSVAFNSTRKWSAVTTAASGTWVLGAPEVLLDAAPAPTRAGARSAADAASASGRRVLLLARTEPTGPDAPRVGAPTLPANLQPVALVVLAERVREDAAETLAYFTEQGVALKIISGDSPRTVGAVAAAVGIDGAADPIDARSLGDDEDDLGETMERHTVFGRVTPHQKRAMVAALQRRGHVVAMTGDGVNDALALKDADIGIAMGNGSPATRAVAQLVLLDGHFSHLPAVVAEGRRVIANIERASNLFLVKNVYALVLALIASISLSAYPLAPVQLTLISTLTIGIPGFLLALAPNAQRYQPGFLARVLRLSLPTGVVTAVAAYGGYRLTTYLDPTVGVREGRTTATIVVLVVAWWTLGLVARPMSPWKMLMMTMLAGVAILAVATPWVAQDFLLLTVNPSSLLVGAVIGGVGALAVEATHRVATAHRASATASGHANVAISTPAMDRSKASGVDRAADGP